MTAANTALYALNRGLLSRRALTRLQLPRYAFSAQVMTNWMPQELGPMSLRPGLKYLASTRSNNASVSIPFVYAISDFAQVELTDSIMRVLADDAPVTRPSHSTTITNGNFSSGVGVGWTDDDDSGATSSVVGGRLSLVGTGNAAARVYQLLSVASADIGVEHALRIKVDQGPVNISLGTSQGGDDLVSEFAAGVGLHSVACTPTTGEIWVQFESYTRYAALVRYCTVEAAGVMALDAPWAEADLDLVRWEQSGGTVFLACAGYQQRKIERRGTRTWSLVLYETSDGPMRLDNISEVTLTSDGLNGDVTLSASADLFYPGHVGALFSLTSTGQTVEDVLSGEDQYTEAIRVSGPGSTRAFTIERSGTWVGTVTLQRSVGEPGAWVDTTTTYSGNGSFDSDDNLDDQVIWYRVGFKPGDYTSGTATVTLTYEHGEKTGFARVTGYTSPTSVSAIVLGSIGSTTATTLWSESRWSDYRGWPTSVVIHESRLWWAGNDRFQGSVTDIYASFASTVEGDSGPMDRSIGFGPVANISWLISAQRLIGGADSSEISVQSSSFNEPLSPTNFTLRAHSTQGSSHVAAVKVDNVILFLDRSGRRVFELKYDLQEDGHVSREVTIHAPEATGQRITKVAVQRVPDTRIHMVREDGKVLVMLFNLYEDVLCLFLIETDGAVEDVCVLPGGAEEEVIYTVARAIGGSTVRYHERFAMESEAYIWSTIYNDESTTTISDLGYPDGTVVTVRDANGDKLQNNLTVSDGAITLDSATTYALITPAQCMLADSYITYERLTASNLLSMPAELDANPPWTVDNGVIITSNPIPGDTADKFEADGSADPYRGQLIDTGNALSGRVFRISGEFWTDAGQPTDDALSLYLYDSEFTDTGAGSFDTFTLGLAPQSLSFERTFDVATSDTTLVARIDGPNAPGAGDYFYVRNVSVQEVSRQVMTGLDHLEGETVVAWGDGKDLGTYTVASGQITLSESVERCVVGLGYTAKFQSVKLAYADNTGTALAQTKRVPRVGFVLADTHHKGVKYGPRFSRLDDMPQVVKGKAVQTDTVHREYDEPMVAFRGEYDTDSRICLQASAPRPATVLGVIVTVDTKDRT